MRLTRIAAIWFAVFGTSYAAAEPIEPADIANQDPPLAVMLASAETVVSLVQSERTITAADGSERLSDLRVSLVVLDKGTGTDVSPTSDVYLSMFNDINEYGLAWSFTPIVASYGFRDFERTGPGLYDIFVRTLNTSGAYGGCPFTLSKVSIDARQLSVAVRQAKGLAEFDAKRYAVPVRIEQQQLGCD